MSGILFAGARDQWPEYAPPLNAVFDAENIKVNIALEMPAEEVEYIIFSPDGALQDFSVFPNLKAVQGLWAGVESVLANPKLCVPFARMVDPNMTAGMVEWVIGNVLRYHLGLDHHILCQNGIWKPTPRASADEIIIAVLGQGELGLAAAKALTGFGFCIRGWSRSHKPKVAGIEDFFGAHGLEKALSGAKGVVLLLPHTRETENIINADTLRYLESGAFLLNPGRGALVEDCALIDALDNGQLSHASLDVFRSEPLPADHIFWHHKKITVSPHIAAETRPLSAARFAAENILRAIKGEPMKYLINPALGY